MLSHVLQAHTIMQALISCPKCNVDRIITDPESGEVVCSLCGLVIEDKTEDTKRDFKQRMGEVAGRHYSTAGRDAGQVHDCQDSCHAGHDSATGASIILISKLNGLQDITAFITSIH